MRTGRQCTLFAALAAVLVAAGCGGGDSGGSSSAGAAKGPPLSHGEFVKKAEALCKDAAKHAPAFPGKKSGSGYQTTASKVVPYLQEVQALNENTLAGLKSLHAPAADQAGAAKLIAAQAARVKDVRDALDAAVAKNGPL